MIPEDAILVSFEVTSLYMSIDHMRGLAAVRRKLEGTGLSRGQDIYTSLTNNQFEM